MLLENVLQNDKVHNNMRHIQHNRYKINKEMKIEQYIFDLMTNIIEKSHRITTNITNSQLRAKHSSHIIKKNKGGMVYEKKEIV